MKFSGEWATATVGREDPVDAWPCEQGCHGHVEDSEGRDNTTRRVQGPAPTPQLPRAALLKAPPAEDGAPGRISQGR